MRADHRWQRNDGARLLNRIPMSWKCLLLTAATAVLPVPALAHGGDEGEGGGSTWALGLMLMREGKPYRQFDNKTEVLPMVMFENRWVRVRGPGLEFKLGQSGPLAYGLTASYAMDGYKASDSPVLDGMARRSPSLWLGARASLRSGPARLSAEASADASGHSDGRRLKLEAERRFDLGGFGLTPQLSATWHDHHFVQYYYGVEAAEARSGRAAYAAGSAVDLAAGLRIDRRIAPGHLLMLDATAVRLGSGIRDSPLVDRSSVLQWRLGYLHSF